MRAKWIGLIAIILFFGVLRAESVAAARSAYFVISLPDGAVCQASESKGRTVAFSFPGLSLIELKESCVEGPRSTKDFVEWQVSLTEGGAQFELNLAALCSPRIAFARYPHLSQVCISVHDTPVTDAVPLAAPLRFV